MNVAEGFAGPGKACQDEPRRGLAAHMRLLLAEFEAAAGSTASALLIHDPERQRFEARWCLPARPRGAAVHPGGGTCLLVRALDLRRPMRVTARGGGASDRCETCCRLFGAPPILAAPVAIGGGQLAVVAAFGPADRVAQRAFSTACRRADLIRAFLTAQMGSRQAERRASELAAVNEVAANLTSVIDIRLLLPKIVAEIRRVVRCDTVGVYLVDSERRQLRLVADSGFSPELRRLYEETAWERMPGIVFRSQQPASTDDLWRDLRERAAPDQWPRLARVRAAQRVRVRSAIWVPIVFGGESLGAIGVGSIGTDAFAEADLSLLTSIANHIAIAIANAQLYQQVDVQLRSKLRDLMNLGHIGRAIGVSLETDAVLQSIVRGTGEAFGDAGSTIMLLDDERQELVMAADHRLGVVGRRIPVSGSASGWVVSHGEPLFVPSVASTEFQPLRSRFDLDGVESFISVPVIVQGKPIGTLNVFNREGKKRFEATDVELLQGLAAQAAIAIEHARLYESVAREKAKLEAIVESLHEGLVLVGPGGAVVHANRRLVDLVGLEGGLPPGENIARAWRCLSARAAAPDEVAEKLAKLESDASQTAVVTLAQPRRQDLEVQSFGVQAPAGKLSGRGYVLRDVTQQAEVEGLKASILSTVSHELRSPLTAIKGFATALLCADIELDQGSQRDFLEQIDRETDRLTMLVRNLLDMSRLDAGAIRFEWELCDLADLVADVVARMAPVVARHKVNLRTGEAEQLARVDRRHLERVIWNLVENAAKYSPPASTITIGLARENGHVVLSVADQGIGVGPDEQERIFERFYRGTGMRSAGVGLGLAICRGIVEAHGGTIAVEGEVDRGSVFSVRLPDHIQVP